MEFLKYIRYAFPVILIFLHTYHFYVQPYRYCDKEECFMLHHLDVIIYFSF